MSHSRTVGWQTSLNFFVSQKYLSKIISNLAATLNVRPHTSLSVTRLSVVGSLAMVTGNCGTRGPVSVLARS